MRDPRDQLTHDMAQLASGHQRHAVLNSSGVLILNALRQSHTRVEDAERELDDLVAQMKAALRERHYDSSGNRKVHRIIVDPPKELVEALKVG